MKADLLKPGDVSYLDKILLDDARLVRALPAVTLRSLDPDHVRLWLHWNAVYQLPSVELVEWLRTRIAGRSAIEIGSGNGAVGRALGIPRTDNRCQEWPDVQIYYALTGQPIVSYGKDVVRLDAIKAIAAYKPKVVVAAWATHLYRAEEHERGGNQYGIDEDAILDSAVGVEAYIHVGATSSHSKKRILSRPHEEVRADWLFSRAKPEDRVIWVWEVERGRVLSPGSA